AGLGAAGVLLATTAVAQDGLHQEAATYLAELVKIDTSNPPGNEIAGARYIKDLLDREGIASTIVESAPGRASLIARLKGSGAKRPLMLMGHVDVVGVERGKRTVAPFAAIVKDGYLLRRGAVDGQAMAAAHPAGCLR